MALYIELPVYRDTYQLDLKVFELTKDFSREFVTPHVIPNTVRDLRSVAQSLT